MKQKCGSVREWLGAFADGELDPERVEQVRAHLETCAGCRHELDQIQELHRLAKSVEHPQLAEDYWDWHRTKVWHGIRNRKRESMPSYRPSFAWPKLAAAAAGLVVVLVVVITGWRSFLQRPGPGGVTYSEHKAISEAPVLTTPPAGRSEINEEPRETGARTPARVEVRSDEVARAEEQTAQGNAATSSGGTVPPPPTATASRKGIARLSVSQERIASAPPAAPSTGGQPAEVTSKRGEGRIVSGPVLLESPTIADADVTDTGTVLLSVKTDSTGRVMSAGVRRSSGSSRLDSLAVRQIRQSRFKAAVKNKRSVPSSFAYPYRFQKKQAKPQDQPEPQEKQVQREQRSIQVEQNVPAQEDKSRKQDSSQQVTPVREKTKK
jgi:TonB family protein